MNEPNLDRVAVIGNSCAGKTTFARRLGEALASRCVELDAIYWQPNWTPLPPRDFRSAVREVVAQERWVVDGNYRVVRDLIWDRATCLVWLNTRFWRVFGRAIRRSVTRIVTREPLFGGNRETIRGAFFSWDGIPWWVIRTHRRRGREYGRLFENADPYTFDRVMLSGPAAVEAFLLRAAPRTVVRRGETA